MKIEQIIRQWHQAGYHVFPLHSFHKNNCACGNPDCQAAGKHPSISKWQLTPLWSLEQLDSFFETGQFDSGYGVLTKGLLLVDIDKRNDGDEALFPEDLQAGCVVATGSGDGSTHHLFKLPAGFDKKINKQMKQYPGIDFLSGSGMFFVGAGSKHKSGGEYRIISGSIGEIEEAPQWLLDEITYKEVKQSNHSGTQSELPELEQIVFAIDNTHVDLEYQDWINVGMAIHHETHGSQEGLKLWSRWSARGAKYDQSKKNECKYHWRSFGKKDNDLITLGTLIHIAKQYGYVEPVTFEPDEDFVFEESEPEHDVPVGDIDLFKPPGLVGEVTDYMNKCSMYPRKKLAVAAALAAVGNIANKYILPGWHTSTNTLFFNVAASATGKGSIDSCVTALLKYAGLNKVSSSGFMSEQEIVRNVTEFNLCFYKVDELGLELKKLTDARSDYLKNVIGKVISMYTSDSGIYTLSVDMQKRAKEALSKEIAKLESIIESGDYKTPVEFLQKKIETLTYKLEFIDKTGGISNPFLSVVGFTTPTTFEHIMTEEHNKSGFLNRTIVVTENETNPQTEVPRGGAPNSPEDIPLRIQKAINRLQNYTQENLFSRYNEELIPIKTTPEGMELMEDILRIYQYNRAEKEKEKTGLEESWRRLAEQVNKISLILSVGTRVRTEYEIRWAYKLCVESIETKLALLTSGESKTMKNLKTILIEKLRDTQVKEGVLIQAMARHKHKFAKADTQKALKELISAGKIDKIAIEHPANKKISYQYTLAT